MILNPKIAEICGIHAGDGYLRDDGKRRELDISGNIEEKEYYDNHVIPLFNKFFKIQIKGKFFPSRNTYGFVIRNLEIIRFIHKLGFPYGSKTLIVKVPNFILGNKHLEKSFLKGYLDTDGCLGFAKRSDVSGNYCEFKKTRNYYPRINFSTVSKYLAEDLKIILRNLGFNFVFYNYQPKNKRNNLKYAFNINGLKNLKNWLDNIGTGNPIKYSRYLVWKKFGFCPTNITYQQRLKILKGLLNPHKLYDGPIA